MNPVRWLGAILIINGCSSSYQIYKQAVENRHLSQRVTELEERITVEDEARRQIQRLAWEQMQWKKEEKKRDASCHKNRKQSL